MTDKVTIDRETLQAALGALTESIDLVQHDYTTDWRHGMPTRKAQLDASELALNQHRSAIDALRAALAAQPLDGFGGNLDDAFEPVESVAPSMDTTLRNAARRSAVIVDRGRLVQPVEPVAQVVDDIDGSNKRVIFSSYQARHNTPVWTKLYAAPPTPAAVPLTDEQIDEIWDGTFRSEDPNRKLSFRQIITRAIERAHGIATAGDKS